MIDFCGTETSENGLFKQFIAEVSSSYKGKCHGIQFDENCVVAKDAAAFQELNKCCRYFHFTLFWI